MLHRLFVYNLDLHLSLFRHITFATFMSQECFFRLKLPLCKWDFGVSPFTLAMSDLHHFFEQLPVTERYAFIQTNIFIVCDAFRSPEELCPCKFERR